MTVFYTWKFPALGGPLPGRTMPDRLADIINVKDWGATGDNSTDDSNAIQAAVAQAIKQGGGQVFFPPGAYMIGAGGGGAVAVGSEDSSIRVDIIGCGSGTTILKGSISKGANTYDNVGTIRQIRIYYGLTLTGSGQIVMDSLCNIDASGATHASIQGVSGVNSPGTADSPSFSTTIGLSLGDNCIAENCRYQGCQYAYALSGRAPMLINCSCETNGTGVRVGWSPGGAKTAYGFAILGQEQERCDYGIDLYDCSGGLVSGGNNQAQIASQTEAAIDNITWGAGDGGTATVTTHVAHNLSAGLHVLQILPGTGAFAPSYGSPPGWIIATVAANPTQFTYYLPDGDPGAYGGGSYWNYPQYYGIRFRKVHDVLIQGQQFGNFAYGTADFDYGGAAEHSNNILACTVFSYGVVLPTTSCNLAGWKFFGLSGAINKLDGVGGWTNNTVAVPSAHMVFNDLPGEFADPSGIYQQLIESQEYDITNGQKVGGGVAAWGDAVETGAAGGGHYLVRYDGTSWKRIG